MPRRAPERRSKASLVDRAAAKTAVKLAVREEMHARKLFPADLGVQLGVSEQEVTRKLSATDGMKHVTLADLALLDRDLRCAIIARLFPDAVVVHVPQAEDIADLVEHHEGAGAAVHEHLLARADGRITRDEAGPLKTAALRELRVAGAVVALADRALEEGVVDLSPTRTDQHWTVSPALAAGRRVRAWRRTRADRSAGRSRPRSPAPSGRATRSSTPLPRTWPRRTPSARRRRARRTRAGCGSSR